VESLLRERVLGKRSRGNKMHLIVRPLSSSWGSQSDLAITTYSHPSVQGVFPRSSHFYRHGEAKINVLDSGTKIGGKR
jgi:hypothetical protein